MDRRTMAANHGMLFEFPARVPVTFWMKDTYLSLDMVFIDFDGTVRRIVESGEAAVGSADPVRGSGNRRAGAERGSGRSDKVEARRQGRIPVLPTLRGHALSSRAQNASRIRATNWILCASGPSDGSG